MELRDKTQYLMYAAYTQLILLLFQYNTVLVVLVNIVTSDTFAIE